jgi:hypothetical protein
LTNSGDDKEKDVGFGLQRLWISGAKKKRGTPQRAASP